MLQSVTKILNKLPFNVMPRKEIYYHPLCAVYFPGICGDIGAATQAGKDAVFFLSRLGLL